MKAIQWTIFCSLVLFLGCGKKKSPPSFAVKPLEGSSIQSFSSVASSVSAATVDCTAELNYWNAAPQTVGRWTANRMTPENYLEHAYAQSLFYDCNARQQALEDSDGELNSSSDIQSVLFTREEEDIPLLDFTRFVAWSGEFDALENRGKLVNLYLQDDGTRTRTRIDLNKRGGLKVVDSVFYATTSAGLVDWSRAYFREVSETEQYVIQRHYDSTDRRIIIVAGHFIEGVGSSIFIEDCDNINPDDANDPCPLGNSPTERYLDEDGNSYPGNLATQRTAAGNDNLIVLATLNTLTDAVDNLERFYTGTVETFFDPVFN